jgi:hypothetical protein
MKGKRRWLAISGLVLLVVLLYREIGRSQETRSDYIAALPAEFGIEGLSRAYRNSGNADLRILFLPSFHPEVLVSIQKRDESVTATLKTSSKHLLLYRALKMSGKNDPRDAEFLKDPPLIHVESIELDEEQKEAMIDYLTGSSFSNRRDPLVESIGLDGISVFYEFRGENGKVNTFGFWSPSKHLNPLCYSLFSDSLAISESSFSNAESESAIEEIKQYH